MELDATKHSRIMLTGTIAEKYRVEGVVGIGGMGIVFAAAHLHLGQRVAIKMLRPELALRPKAVDRFLREARAASRLRGEHIVRVLDAGTLDDGTAYIVMELLAGTDFAALLRDGPLPVRTAVDYVLQACTAIAEAHAYGIVHRDLKPANLFLTRRADGSPCVKVLDFGISKTLEGDRRDAHSETDPSSDRLVRTVRPAEEPVSGVATPWYAQTLTNTRAAMGSPRYMSPEQMSSARDVDARADVWGLGGLLHELVSGSPAFDAKDGDALRASVLSGAPRALAGVPPELAAIARRCLEKDRERRFPDVGSLARALVPFGPAGSDAAALCIERILAGPEQAPEGDLPLAVGRVSAFSFGATNDDAAGPRPGRQRALRRLGATAALLGCVAAAGTIGVRFAGHAGAGAAFATSMALSVVVPSPSAVEVPVAEPAPQILPPASIASREPQGAPPPAVRPHLPRALPAHVAAPAPSAVAADPLAVEGGELFDVRK